MLCMENEFDNQIEWEVKEEKSEEKHSGEVRFFGKR